MAALAMLSLANHTLYTHVGLATGSWLVGGVLDICDTYKSAVRRLGEPYVRTIPLGSWHGRGLSSGGVHRTSAQCHGRRNFSMISMI